MAVRSLKNSTLENFANYSSSMNAGYDFNDFELIESVFVASNTASVTFNNLNQYSTDYKHLQIRSSTRTTVNGDGAEGLVMRFNSDSGSNYSRHSLNSVSSSSTSSNVVNGNYVAAGIAWTSVVPAFGSSICDIIDAYSTTKNKTVKSFTGNPGAYSNISLHSGLWINTSSINSISISLTMGNFASGSRLSLYGIR